MEAVPPIERIVSPETAEISRTLNSVSDTITQAVIKGKGQVTKAFKQFTDNTRDKLGINASAVLLATTLGAGSVILMVGSNNRRNRRTRHNIWNTMFSSSMFIPIPSIAQLCSNDTPVEVIDNDDAAWERSRIGCVVGVMGDDILVDKALSLLFGYHPSSNSSSSSHTGLQADISTNPFIADSPVTSPSESPHKRDDVRDDTCSGQQVGMMILRARGCINNTIGRQSGGSLQPSISARERLEASEALRKVVSINSDHIFFVVGSLTIEEHNALEEVLTRATKTNTPVTVLHVIPGCKTMDDLLAAFQHQLECIYRPYAAEDNTSSYLHPTPYKDYAFCACCPSTMVSSTTHRRSSLAKHYAISPDSGFSEAIRQIRSEMMILLRGVTALGASKCESHFDTESPMDSDGPTRCITPIDIIRKGLQKTLMGYCAVVSKVDSSRTEEAYSDVNSDDDDDDDHGTDMIMINVVKTDCKETLSWKDRICRKFGITQSPRRKQVANLTVGSTNTRNTAEVIPTSQGLMFGEPSLIPRSSVYETIDNDGRTTIKHIDIEAPGVSFDDIEVSVVKREWLSCTMMKPLPENMRNRLNFTENTIAYGMVHQWFWLGNRSGTMKSGDNDDAGIMYRPMPQPNGISLYNGVLAIQLYRIDTSHVVKRRLNPSVADGSAITSTATGRSRSQTTETKKGLLHEVSNTDAECKESEEDRVRRANKDEKTKVGLFG